MTPAVGSRTAAVPPPDDVAPVPVIIVGAGPTGLAAATLLAQYGVECLVLDHWDSVYPQPRAVHLDDEVYRILARLGVRDEFATISRPSRGLRLVEPGARVLAEFSRDGAVGPNGYPPMSMFDQPELERLLRDNLKRYPTATLRGNAEVLGLAQDAAGRVRVDLLDRVTGEHDTLRAQYVLGCDGANSLARTAIGATMIDLQFTQRWLVIDIATDADLDEWEGVQQVCDPQRAATFMRIGPTRYRWEFRLAPNETADSYRDLDRLHSLISPWTKNIPVEQLELLRVAAYTFRAQIADRWRDRRIFLLGDAAHLTPPFIGQGMGAGLRDAANLAWKLAGVLHGALPETLLSSYEIERKPHARAMIGIAKAMGTAMTAGGELGTMIRHVLAPAVQRVHRLTRRGAGHATPSLHRSDLVVRPRLRPSLAGSLCPNALLDDGRRLDELAAGRFILVSTIPASATQRAEIECRDTALLVVRPGSRLHRRLRRRRAHAAIVRPDGTVMRDGRDLDELVAALPASSLARAPQRS